MHKSHGNVERYQTFDEDEMWHWHCLDCNRRDAQLSIPCTFMAGELFEIDNETLEAMANITPDWPSATKIFWGGIIGAIFVYFTATGMFFAYQYWTQDFVCVGN
jgi:hypothetical protein